MITQSSKLLQVLSLKKPMGVPPVWFMRQAGRYLPEYREVRRQAGSFLDLCYTPHLAAEVTLQPLHRFNLDAAIIFSDILLIPQALGQKLTFVENHGPKLEAISLAKGIPSTPMEHLSQALEAVYEAISITRATLDKQKPLFGFVGAPWTLACYMMEGQGSKNFIHARTQAYSHNDVFQHLLSLLEEACYTHLVGQIKAGVDVVQIFDSWSGVVPWSMMEPWCFQPSHRIAQRLKDAYPHVPIIYFPRGCGLKNLALLKDTQAFDGIGIDETLCLTDAVECLPFHTLQGNLDPAVLRAGGDHLDAAIDALLTATQNHPHIFNLGHGVDQHTPIDHIHTTLKRIHSYAA